MLHQFSRKKILWTKRIIDLSVFCLRFQKFLKGYFRGYRKGFSTHYALLSLIERWKKILDEKGFGGAVLMDLSKAFDALNHELLTAKLSAYDFDNESLKLIRYYLTNR